MKGLYVLDFRSLSFRGSASMYTQIIIKVHRSDAFQCFADGQKGHYIQAYTEVSITTSFSIGDCLKLWLAC